MYIGGKYQCHGNGTVPFLCKLSAGSIEKSPAVVITGLLGWGGRVQALNEQCLPPPPAILEPCVPCLLCSSLFYVDLCPTWCAFRVVTCPSTCFSAPMQTSTSVPWGSTSAAALPDVTTSTGPTSVNAKMATRATDGTVCVSKSCPAHVFRKYGVGEGHC